MSEITEVLSIIGLFFLRIGVPLLVLLVIGTLIERAYRRREANDIERPVSVELPVRADQPQEVEEVAPAKARRSARKRSSS